MDNTINANFEWERNEDYIWENLDEGDGVVILDLTRQKVFELNEGAAWLWKCLDKPRSKDDLAVTVCLKHKLDFDDVIEVVDQFIGQSREAGILHVRTSPAHRLFKRLRRFVRLVAPSRALKLSLSK